LYIKKITLKQQIISNFSSKRCRRFALSFWKRNKSII